MRSCNVPSKLYFILCIRKSKVALSEKGTKYIDFRTKHEIKQILKCLDGILHERKPLISEECMVDGLNCLALSWPANITFVKNPPKKFKVM